MSRPGAASIRTQWPSKARSDRSDPRRGTVSLTAAASIALRPGVRRSCSARRDTRSASSRRSATRSSPRPWPMTTSGSAATTSVHCRGTEQTWSASVRSRSLVPYRLYRSPTQTSCRPLSGWKGWVTRTRRVPVSEEPVVRAELQAAAPCDLPHPAGRGAERRFDSPLGCRARGADRGSRERAKDVGRFALVIS